MKLISDIINELVDAEKSVSSPFLKTKVLASRLGNQELLTWVDQELNGYNSGSVPEYRNYGCLLNGDYINGNMHHKNHPVHIAGIDDDIQKMLTSLDFTHSIAGLESMIKENKNGTVERPLEADIVNFIQNNVIRMGNPYFRQLNARKVISINVAVEILSVVRNRLLDFMLKVDEQFGSLTEIDLKNKKVEISKIMKKTIIKTGDGAIVSTGKKSKISATINISKGNKNELEKELHNHGINKDDSDELLSVIDVEIPTTINQQFGDKVNSWIQKMIGKSLNGTWQVGIATAGTLLAEIIKKYYGL